MKLFTTESYYNIVPYALNLLRGEKVYVVATATSWFSNYKIYFTIYLETHCKKRESKF